MRAAPGLVLAVLLALAAVGLVHVAPAAAAGPGTPVREAPAGVGTALSLARTVRYLGIGGVVGLLVLLLVVWTPLRDRGRIAVAADEAFVRAAGRTLRALAIVGLVGSLLGLVLQGASARGTGVGTALGPAALWHVAGTRVGAWFVVTALAFLAFAVRAPVLVRVRGGLRAPAARAALVLVVLLVIAPALGGQSASSSPAWALIPIEILHVSAMGAWLGGLLALLLVLPRATRALEDGPARTALLAATLVRFSPVALVSVAVLTTAGTGLAILHLTTLYDLTDTAYGRAILVKVVLLVGVIGVAVLQREYLLPRLRRLAEEDTAAGVPTADGLAVVGPTPAPAAGRAQPAPVAGVDDLDDEWSAEEDRPPSPATPQHVQRALRTEAALLVAVLVATGALAGYTPPRSAPAGPVSVVRSVGGVRLVLVVDPAGRGPNTLRLRAMTSGGVPVRASALPTGRAVPPGRSGGSDVPVALPFTSAGAGRWAARGVRLGTAGGWNVDVVVPLAGGRSAAAVFPVRVR